MKRNINIVCSCLLAISCFSINVSAAGEFPVTEITKAEEASVVIEDTISQSVLQSGLFEEEKIQTFDSFVEGNRAINDLIEANTRQNQMQRSSGNVSCYVDNCVMVKTEQDIAFDTSNVIAGVRYGNKYYIQYETVLDAENAIEVLNTYPSVQYAEADGIIAFDTGDVYEDVDARTSQDIRGYTHYTWGADAMAMPVFADYTSRTTTDSVVVAVLDSGVNADHELFQGRLLDGYDCAYEDDDPRDYQGHGTHVAGIIADCTQGLDVKILPVQVLKIEPLTMGTTGTICDTVQGIEYAVNNGADVINMSLGNVKGAAAVCNEVDEAISKGIIVVIASGNSYAKLNANQHTHCPAHKTNAIVTAAIDSNLDNYISVNEDGKIIEGSNYGPSIDLAAPGVAIKSAYFDASDKYVEKTGTSMAAPHISAAAAMLKLHYPNASCSEIEEKLQSCAMDLGTTGNDWYYGAGLPILNDLIETLPFDDVMTADWYYESIFEIYTRGYMTGRSRNNFNPTYNMKRHDVAALFYRMAGNPFVEYRKIYEDVEEDAYYANAAVWAYDNEILTGYMNGNLGVDDDIVRQDFAIILQRYADYLGFDVSETADISGYADAADVSEYARTAVSWAVENGFMGRSGTTLNPLGVITRAEAAAIIYRFIDTYNL